MQILSTSKGQAKLGKSVALEIFSTGVNLMPANTLGIFLAEASEADKQKAKDLFQKRGGNISYFESREESMKNISLCPNFSTCGARGGRNCLLGSGQNWMSQASKVAKTMFYLLHREEFFSMISKEGEQIFRNKNNKAVSGRFNLLSDIPSASMRYHETMRDLANEYGKTYFAYEYTKLPWATWQRKVEEYNNQASSTSSFRIVFSTNKGGGGEGSNNRKVKSIEEIASEALPFLRNNHSIAIIVPDKEKQEIMQSTENKGFAIIDGDEHDIRSLDEQKAIVFLSAKGMLRTESRKDTLTDVFSKDEVKKLVEKLKDDI